MLISYVELNHMLYSINYGNHEQCGDHEIFITKIFNHGIFSNFMKILNHKNLELYGMHEFVKIIKLTV